MDLIIQADAFKRTGNASFADIAGDVSADFDDALTQRGILYCSTGEKARGPFPRWNKHEIDGPSGPRQNQPYCIYQFFLSEKKSKKTIFPCDFEMLGYNMSNFAKRVAFIIRINVF